MTYFWIFLGFLLTQDVVLAACPLKPDNTSDWIEYGSQCYQFIDELSPVLPIFAWSEALTECHKLHPLSNLASISSESENTWIQGHLRRKRPYYIGLYRSRIDKSFKWVDGAKLDYTAWHTEPTLDSDACVAYDMDDHPGTWRDMSCLLNFKSFICKMPNVPLPTPEPELRCPGDQWLPRGEFCYLMIGDKLLSWNDATKACQYYGGNLASVLDFTENYFLQTAMDASQSLPLRMDFWIGGSRENSGSPWYWIDGKEWGYENWDSEQETPGENCAEYDIREATWRIASCSDFKPYVCKTRREFSGSTPTTSPSSETTSAQFTTEKNAASTSITMTTTPSTTARTELRTTVHEVTTGTSDEPSTAIVATEDITEIMATGTATDEPLYEFTTVRNTEFTTKTSKSTKQDSSTRAEEVSSKGPPPTQCITVPDCPTQEVIIQPYGWTPAEIAGVSVGSAALLIIAIIGIAALLTHHKRKLAQRQYPLSVHRDRVSLVSSRRSVNQQTSGQQTQTENITPWADGNKGGPFTLAN